VQQEKSTSRPYVCSDFQQKRPLKNPAKSSERIGPGYSEAARGLGSSGRVAQRGIEIAQEGYHEIQEKKNIYVLLKHLVMQQRTNLESDNS